MSSAPAWVIEAIDHIQADSNFRVYEHMYMDHGLQDVFVEGPIKAIDSAIEVPRGPGLGLTVDTSKIDRMKH